ncbi:hypothetical protein [Flavobacterium sp. 2]
MNKTNILKILIVALTNVLSVMHFGNTDDKNDIKKLNFSISELQVQ